jgi:hypothetical protein
MTLFGIVAVVQGFSVTMAVMGGVPDRRRFSRWLAWHSSPQKSSFADE